MAIHTGYDMEEDDNVFVNRSKNPTKTYSDEAADADFKQIQQGIDQMKALQKESIQSSKNQDTNMNNEQINPDALDSVTEAAATLAAETVAAAERVTEQVKEEAKQAAETAQATAEEIKESINWGQVCVGAIVGGFIVAAVGVVGFVIGGLLAQLIGGPATIALIVGSIVYMLFERLSGVNIFLLCTEKVNSFVSSYKAKRAAKKVTQAANASAMEREFAAA